MTFYERFPNLLEDRLVRERERLLRDPQRACPPANYRPAREVVADMGLDIDEVAERGDREMNQQIRNRPDCAWIGIAQTLGRPRGTSRGTSGSALSASTRSLPS